MLQKAKSIKKTLKTEAKAIAYGTERVDKRGKPVTSIADRTNVRCVILIWFLRWVLRCLALMGWQDFSKRFRARVVFNAIFSFLSRRWHSSILSFFNTLSQIRIITTGVRVEIDGAERILGARKRVRESVQQRPLRAEGETRKDVTVSVRRRAREFAGSSLRGGY